MQKLKLNVEELEVSSFVLETEDKARGTVNAHSDGDVTYTCGDPFSSLYRYYRKMMTY